MRSNLDRRLTALEDRSTPKIFPCADYYHALLMTPEEAAQAGADVNAWRANQVAIPPAKLAEIRQKASARADEIHAAAAGAYDPTVWPFDEPIGSSGNSRAVDLGISEVRLSNTQ